MPRAPLAALLAAALLVASPSPVLAAGSGTADEFTAGISGLSSKLSGSSPSAAQRADVHRAKATLINGSLDDQVLGMSAAKVIGGLDCVSLNLQMARDASSPKGASARVKAAARCRDGVAAAASAAKASGLAGDLRLVKSKLAAIAAKAKAGRAFGSKATALRALQSSIVAKRFSGQTLHGVPFAQVYDDLECIDVKVEAGRTSGAASCAKRLLRRAGALAPAKDPVTFGSDLTGTPVALPDRFAPEDTEFWTDALTVPVDGTITTFRLKTGDSPVDLPLRFSVVRPNGDGSVTVVTTTNPVYPLKAHDAAVHTYPTSGLSFPCCKVKKGDIVSVDNSGTQTPGAYVWFAEKAGSTTFSHTSGGDSQNAGFVWRPITHPGYETLVQVVEQPD